LLIGCFDRIGDLGPSQPSSKGFFYIDNQTGYVLDLKATTVGDVQFPWPLLENTVPADTVVNFFIYDPGSTTDLSPTNIFGEFTVTTSIEGEDSLVYQGVQNGDWEIREITEGPHYFLLLPR